METSVARFGDPDPEGVQSARFEFGTNWQDFLSVLNDSRIAEAGNSLKSMLGLQTLEGMSFLDVGCGSGLFSLAAMRMGAVRVLSFDFDSQSVACARELKRRYFPAAVTWTVEQGSVLDTAYLQRLGQWDIVYSWGVLHHTGNMWQALENVIPLVRVGGYLFVSIYNDQGLQSALWKHVKRFHNRGRVARWLVIGIAIPLFVSGLGLVDLGRGHNPVSRYRHYDKLRGMSIVHDWLDWLGGYPFQVARPEQISNFYCQRGFELRHLKTCGDKLGCNEFVLQKSCAASCS